MCMYVSLTVTLETGPWRGLERGECRVLDDCGLVSRLVSDILSHVLGESYHATRGTCRAHTLITAGSESIPSPHHTERAIPYVCLCPHRLSSELCHSRESSVTERMSADTKVMSEAPESRRKSDHMHKIIEEYRQLSGRLPLGRPVFNTFWSRTNILPQRVAVSALPSYELRRSRDCFSCRDSLPRAAACIFTMCAACSSEYTGGSSSFPFFRGDTHIRP